MPCLDTSAILDLAGRSGPARMAAVETCIQDVRAAGQQLTTTRICEAELWVGVELSANRPFEVDKLHRMLRGLVMLEFDKQAARRFGMIKSHLRRIGTVPGDMDMLIASIASAHGQPILTGNPRHFMHVPGLIVTTY